MLLYKYSKNSIYEAYKSVYWYLQTYLEILLKLLVTSIVGYTRINSQSWARNNTVATMWPCFQATQLLVTALLQYSLWLLHLDTETLTYFEFSLVPEALLRCRVVVVAKLKKMTRAQLCKFVVDDEGAGHGHVEAHEPAGWPQDDGGDEEGGRQRGPPTRQLYRQNTGQLGSFCKTIFGPGKNVKNVATLPL